MGHIKTEPQQYAGFIRTGYDAVKEVFPDAIVIVHLDRGHEQRLYDHNLDTILKYGGKFDMIGMSLYPYWAMDGGVFYWEPQCLPGGYKLGAFDSNTAPTVIMDGFLQ